MPMLPSQFNADDHDDMQSFDPIPAGSYNVEIVDSELQLTKNAKKAKEAGEEDFESQGQMVVPTFKILDGKNKGKEFKIFIIMVHPNATTAKIGNELFGAICKAIGNKTPEKTEELHKIPFRVDLDIDSGYNRIKKVHKYDEAVSSNQSEEVEKKSSKGKWS